MVVGVPTGVAPYDGGGERAGLRDVVLDVLAARDIPVLAQVDFGHTAPNLLLPVGDGAAGMAASPGDRRRWRRVKSCFRGTKWCGHFWRRWRRWRTSSASGPAHRWR
ncbi:hypothetical protein OG702_28945 [Streptomyces sp. NBC_01198]|nr:hypothetical protein OG702_28945 [Streptomyces sp. NBC_01198]